MKTTQNWSVYIIESESTKKLYTGITTDPRKRLEKHNTGKGAKATRVGRPWSIVYREASESKSAALKREAAIKKLPRIKKLILIQS